MLLSSDEPIKGITINAETYFDAMKKTILVRKKRVEKRLINEDESVEVRAQLRGELDGLDFCLKVIDANR